MRSIGQLAAVVVVMLAAALPGVAGAATPTQMIPAYFYPDAVNWPAATTGSVPGSILILNPASGPGRSVDPTYVKVVRAAQAAGRQVVGYVPTTYGTRRASAVRADVKKYADWYAVDGIFFDEASADRGPLRYYRDLYAYVKGAVTPVVGPNTVVLNPGVVPDEQYMGASDVIVSFENTVAAYDAATFPAWTTKPQYAPGRFAHLVHGAATEADMQRAVCLARRRNAGRVYVTDDVMANPWDVLPSYWQREGEALLSDCAAVGSATALLSRPSTRSKRRRGTPRLSPPSRGAERSARAVRAGRTA